MSSTSGISCTRAKRLFQQQEEFPVPEQRKKVAISHCELQHNNGDLLTNATLQQQYECLGLIGNPKPTISGVFSVSPKSDPNQSLALKITKVPPSPVLEILEKLWSEQISIHLNPLTVLGKIAVGSKDFVCTEDLNFFVKPISKKQTTAHFADVQIMPLRESDLKTYRKKNPLSPAQNVAIQVQLAALDALLDSRGVVVIDGKDANVFCRKISADDYFQGQSLLKADCWKYVVQGENFYIKPSDVIVERGDYDDWTLKTEKHPPFNFLEKLQVKLNRAEREILEGFKKRPINSSLIIPMN